jgi:hypothetical protein
MDPSFQQPLDPLLTLLFGGLLFLLVIFLLDEAMKK